MVTKAKAGKNGAVNRIAGSADDVEVVSVKPLRQRSLEFSIRGVAPLMQCKFSEKAKNKMADTQKQGQQSRGKKVREPRDFEVDCEGARHQFDDGSSGHPASAFRNAMISACRMVGFAMTRAKLSIFIEADGLDKIDGTPLVAIEGEHEQTVLPVRNSSGVADLRSRPMWREWSATLRIRFDEDQFSAADVTNLLVRAGAQVGVGEGRPDSKASAGLGYGLFEVLGVE